MPLFKEAPVNWQIRLIQKRFLYAVMLLLGMSMFCSCEKEQAKNSNDYSKLILGEWQYTHWEEMSNGEVVNSGEADGILVFYDDGTCREGGQTYQYPITGSTLYVMGMGHKIQTLTSEELIFDFGSAEVDYEWIRYYLQRRK